MEKTMKKTILTLIAIIMLVSSVTVIPANAAIADPGETVEPMWDNTDLVSITMDYLDDGYGYSECLVYGKYGTSSIVVEIVVYKRVALLFWKKVAEKTEVFNDDVALASCRFSPAVGATYKSTYKITVTQNGTDEVIEKTLTSTYE